MISIIVCSRDDAKFAAMSRTFAERLAPQPLEFVRIPDARSLAEGYNRGVEQSRGDLLLFSHDDVEVISADFSIRLLDHMRHCDVLGVAGTTRLLNARWYGAGIPHIFGQIAHPATGAQGYEVDLYCAPRRRVGNIQALDGLLLAANRNVLDKVRFDADTFDGFHAYDVDFTFSAFRAGLKLAVACDISVIHLSGGQFDETWEHYAGRFAAKHASYLPRIVPKPFRWSSVQARNKAHLLEVMQPAYWDQEG